MKMMFMSCDEDVRDVWTVMKRMFAVCGWRWCLWWLERFWCW